MGYLQQQRALEAQWIAENGGAPFKRAGGYAAQADVRATLESFRQQHPELVDGPEMVMMNFYQRRKILHQVALKRAIQRGASLSEIGCREREIEDDQFRCEYYSAKAFLARCEAYRP